MTPIIIFQNKKEKLISSETSLKVRKDIEEDLDSSNDNTKWHCMFWLLVLCSIIIIMK